MIKKLITTIIVIIALLGVITIGGYIYIRTKYEIDLFNTVSQLKTLLNEPDENNICEDPIVLNDYDKMKSTINNNLGEIVTKENDNYIVNLNNLTASTLTSPLILTSKETGALCQSVIDSQKYGKIKLGDHYIEIKILNMSFINIKDTSIDIKVILKVNMNSLKNTMNKFPYSLFIKYIPDVMYFTSIFTINKTNKGFEYEVSNVSLGINELNEEETNELLVVLNTIFKTGTADEINVRIGNSIANALIGNEKEPGFAYTMIAASASQFVFETIDKENCFVIK